MKTNTKLKKLLIIMLKELKEADKAVPIKNEMPRAKGYKEAIREFVIPHIIRLILK